MRERLNPKNLPFYHLVPKGYDENLKFRRKMVEYGCQSEENAHELWIMCARDYLFYINTFVYTFNPRLAPRSSVIPFITWDFQDDAVFETMMAILEGYDLRTEKSRDMGASWIYLMCFEYLWHYQDYMSFRLVSRNEDLVEKTEFPDALFWKIDFILKWLPKWLRPLIYDAHLHMVNRDNASTLDGASTTGDVTRGGRCTAMLLDEFAAVPDGSAILSSTRDVTDCRLFNSTHKGAGTAFYRLGKTPIRKLRLHWRQHPEKSLGLYTAKNGILELLDDFRGVVTDIRGIKYNFPEEYPFRLDGKLRSPWYDLQCDRAEHPMEIAQELDIDPFSSDFQFFDTKIIELIDARDIRPPYHVGELEYDSDTLQPLEFIEEKGAFLRLWMHLTAHGKVAAGDSFAIGLDISAGTGASNSAASIGNLNTREKVGEFANPYIKPEAFASLAIAMAYFFNKAYLIWDGSGPGNTFGQTVIDLGYRKVYYKRDELGLAKKQSDKAGFFFTPNSKRTLMSMYRKSLKAMTFIQRSYEANRECLQYVFTTSNTIEHSSSLHNVDPSGARANHGDRCIADALLSKAFDIFANSPTVVEAELMPECCPAARRLARKQKAREVSTW